jgi:hypothetical protein
MPVEEIAEEINPRGVPAFEAIAPQGVGIFETLKDSARQVILELKKNY